MRATGYAEVLETDIPPWQLPINELRWGRAIGASSSVVWIDWRGSVPLTLILLDGEPVDGSVDDRRVAFADRSITLTPTRLLRDGPIGTTALASIPGLSSWAPAAILAAHETKWFSSAACTGPPPFAGRAIHEVVRFRSSEEGRQ
jgi:hypothetical protein